MVARVLLLVLLWAGSSRAGDFVDTGQMSKAHAPLDGLANCIKCHPSSTGAVSRQACFACHPAVATAAKGVHRENRASGCESCHHEHRGASFPLIPPAKRK